MASFVPKAPSATSNTEYFNEPVVWALLAVVGIVVGLAIGLLVFGGSGGSAAAGAGGSQSTPRTKSNTESTEEPQGGEP